MSNLIDITGHLSSNGEEVPYEVVISIPKQLDDSGDYLCQVVSDRLFTRTMNVYGVSRNQAIRLAITLLKEALTSRLITEQGEADDVRLVEDVVAEHRLTALYPDGELIPVSIQVGRPRPHPKGDYACAVQLQGLRICQGPREFHGVGSFQALMIAIRYLYNTLSIEVEGGAILHRLGVKDPLELSDLFALQQRENE